MIARGKSGAWDDNSIKFIDESITDAVNKFNFDIDKFTLIGLSNGGLIFPEYLVNSKYTYDNVVALSTYLDSKKYKDEGVKESLINSQFVYIYGNNDQRIGIEDSLKSLEYLDNFGIKVEINKIKGDHLILFEDRDNVLRLLRGILIN